MVLTLEGQHEFNRLHTLLTSSGPATGPDSIYWRWNTSGLFTAKSAYDLLSFDGVDDRKIAHLWGMRIPLKIKIFLWLASRYRLLTADLLAKRGWLGPSICPLCCAGEEFLDHIFFLCPFARSVWTEVLHNATLICQRLLNTQGDLASRWRSARGVATGQSKTVLDLLFAAGCWEIWIERNKRLFENRLSTSDGCATRVHTIVEFWSLASFAPGLLNLITADSGGDWTFAVSSPRGFRMDFLI